MKNSMTTLLLAISLVPPAVAATADKAASAPPKNAVSKSAASAKKTPKKQLPHKTKSGKVATGEAARQAKKETGDEREVREENRGRISATHRAKLHPKPTQVAKATSGNKHSTVAGSHPKSATVQNTSHSQATATLKTSQLTSAKAAQYHAKGVSLQHAPEAKGKTRGKKTPAPDPAPDNQSNSISLKPHNARTF